MSAKNKRDCLPLLISHFNARASALSSHTNGQGRDSANTYGAKVIAVIKKATSAIVNLAFMSHFPNRCRMTNRDRLSVKLW
jgi:hypothetical protein